MELSGRMSPRGAFWLVDLARPFTMLLLLNALSDEDRGIDSHRNLSLRSAASERK